MVFYRVVGNKENFFYLFVGFAVENEAGNFLLAFGYVVPSEHYFKKRIAAENFRHAHRVRFKVKFQPHHRHNVDQ